MKTHTHTATVRDMRTLANRAEQAAERAEQAADLCRVVPSCAESAQEAAKIAENAAIRTAKAELTIIIAMLINILINAALLFFALKLH